MKSQSGEVGGELRSPELWATGLVSECLVCGRSGHYQWDCDHTFAILRAYDQAERARAILRTSCQHGERMVWCLAARCRNAVYAVRNPKPQARRR